MPAKEISVKNLAQIIHARTSEILDFVTYHLKQVGLDHRMLNGGIILTGGGSQLKHLIQLTEYATGLNARIGLPNEHLAPIDFDQEWAAFQESHPYAQFTDLLSSLLYPKVFEDYWKFRMSYGDVSRIQTPVFFFGLKEGEETIIEIARGKSIIIRLQSIGPVNEEGMRHSQLLWHELLELIECSVPIFGWRQFPFD